MNLHYTTAISYSGLFVYLTIIENNRYPALIVDSSLSKPFSDISQDISSFMASATTPWPDFSFKLLLKTDQGLSEQRGKKSIWLMPTLLPLTKSILWKYRLSHSSVSNRKAHALLTILSLSQISKTSKKHKMITDTFSHDQRISTNLCNVRPIHSTSFTVIRKIQFATYVMDLHGNWLFFIISPCHPTYQQSHTCLLIKVLPFLFFFFFKSFTLR